MPSFRKSLNSCFTGKCTYGRKSFIALQNKEQGIDYYISLHRLNYIRRYSNYTSGHVLMKKTSLFLRLFSDFINSALLILVLLKGEYTIAILIAVVFALSLKIMADIVE